MKRAGASPTSAHAKEVDRRLDGRVATLAAAGAYAVLMSREPERPGDVSAKAIIELGPIVGRLREELDLDARSWDLVVKALTRALMAGVRIGGAEVAAQAIESGLDVRLNLRVQTSDAGED